MKFLRNPLVVFLVLGALLIGGIMLYKNVVVDVEIETTANVFQKDKAPDFTVVDEEGKEVKLSDFEGKPIVLNFFASWCGYCISEMRDFDEVFKERGTEVQFMMVDAVDNRRETLEVGKRFIARGNYAFPALYDVNQDAVKKYGVQNLPITFFIDAEGNLIAVAEGRISQDVLNQGIDIITGKVEPEKKK